MSYHRVSSLQEYLELVKQITEGEDEIRARLNETTSDQEAIRRQTGYYLNEAITQPVKDIKSEIAGLFDQPKGIDGKPLKDANDQEVGSKVDIALAKGLKPLETQLRQLVDDQGLTQISQQLIDESTQLSDILEQLRKEPGSTKQIKELLKVGKDMAKDIKALRSEGEIRKDSSDSAVEDPPTTSDDEKIADIDQQIQKLEEEATNSKSKRQTEIIERELNNLREQRSRLVPLNPTSSKKKKMKAIKKKNQDGQGLTGGRFQHKVVGGRLGKLKINENKLKKLHLVAQKGRSKVFDGKIPFDLFELLTKRFNPRKKYDGNSLAMYKQIADLAELDVSQKGSQKVKIARKGGSVKLISTGSPGEIYERLKVLQGSKNAGNKSKEIVAEASQLLDVLKNQGRISQKVYEDSLRSFLSVFPA